MASSSSSRHRGRPLRERDSKQDQTQKEPTSLHSIPALVAAANAKHSDQMATLERVRAGYAALDVRTRTILEMKCADLRRQRPMLHLAGQQRVEHKYGLRVMEPALFQRAYSQRLKGMQQLAAASAAVGPSADDQRRREQQRRDDVEREALFGAPRHQKHAAAAANKAANSVQRECGRLWRILDAMRDGVPPPEDAMDLLRMPRPAEQQQHQQKQHAKKPEVVRKKNPLMVTASQTTTTTAAATRRRL
jgi:hypothetical protein